MPFSIGSLIALLVLLACLVLALTAQAPVLLVALDAALAVAFLLDAWPRRSA